MMNRRPVNELAQKAGSRYLLVTAVANRARQLQDAPDALGNNKPLSTAVAELYADKLIVIPSKEA